MFCVMLEKYEQNNSDEIITFAVASVHVLEMYCRIKLTVINQLCGDHAIFAVIITVMTEPEEVSPFPCADHIN